MKLMTDDNRRLVLEWLDKFGQVLQDDVAERFRQMWRENKSLREVIAERDERLEKEKMACPVCESRMSPHPFD